MTLLIFILSEEWQNNIKTKYGLNSKLQHIEAAVFREVPCCHMDPERCVIHRKNGRDDRAYCWQYSPIHINLIFFRNNHLLDNKSTKVVLRFPLKLQATNIGLIVILVLIRFYTVYQLVFLNTNGGSLTLILLSKFIKQIKLLLLISQVLNFRECG